MKPAKLSWKEEHDAFEARAAEIRPTGPWKFGIYQDISDDAAPQTRLKDNNFYEFLAPEEHLSLKLFFDNFRNYGICAAFAALGASLWLSGGGVLTVLPIPQWLLQLLTISTWALVACLLLLNIAQTWLLSNELFFAIRSIRVARMRIYRWNGPLIAAIAHLHLVASILIDWFVLLAFRLFAIALVALCIGIVVYAVLASPSLRS